MVSSVPACKAAILARLRGHDRDDFTSEAEGLAGVQVSWGSPHPKDQQRELIYIGAAKGVARVYTAGLARANEFYQLEIIIDVLDSSQRSQQELLTRAYELMAIVEASIVAWAHEDNPFDGAVNIMTVGPLTDNEIIPEENTQVRVASITCELNVKARIS